MERTKGKSLSEQRKQRVQKKEQRKSRKINNIISTGSTLLDLAISGSIVRGGGIPGGILVEIYGPSGCGKTVLLCEIAGDIQRKGGDIHFNDPESRLNKQFAKIFDLDITPDQYRIPDTISQVFKYIRKLEPENINKINGVMTDSLAALSTDMELADKDQYGMRRAKEFSEELRKTCRVITKNNILLVCSNQIRENVDAGAYGQKYRSPGGMGIPFYASLRLQCTNPQKLKRTKKLKSGKEVTRVIGVETEITVVKSSIDAPYRSAKVPIIFDYGIDDIRQNLQFIKDSSKEKVFTLGGEKLSNSLDHACKLVEDNNAELELKNEVIDTWEELEQSFHIERKKKERHG